MLSVDCCLTKHNAVVDLQYKQRITGDTTMAKRTTIKLLETDGTIELPGYETSIPGLVVHQENHKFSWSVSHAPSGYRVFSHLRTRRDALAVASRLTVVSDTWDKPMEDIHQDIDDACRNRQFNQRTFVKPEEKV